MFGLVSCPSSLFSFFPFFGVGSDFAMKEKIWRGQYFLPYLIYPTFSRSGVWFKNHVKFLILVTSVLNGIGWSSVMHALPSGTLETPWTGPRLEIMVFWTNHFYLEHCLWEDRYLTQSFSSDIKWDIEGKILLLSLDLNLAGQYH